LIDFGVAEISLPPDLLTESRMGTKIILAPESFSNAEKISGSKSDIWGAGCSLFYLLFGSYPIIASTTKELRSKLLSL